MKVLLINPPAGEKSWYRAEHLGIGYLAAVLRQAGHEAHLLDATLEDLDVDGACHAARTRLSEVALIGLTAIDPESWQAGIDVARQLRSDGMSFHLTAGGYLPTFWYEELLTRYPEVDSVVIGEGEATLAELAEALEQHRSLKQVPGLVVRDRTGAPLVTPPRELIRNLDDLPFPARDYLSTAYQKYHHALVYSSRGCYHKCSFCQIAQFYRLSSGVPYRTRSARNIADEIELLVTKHGVRSIFFVDDEFISESKRRRNVIEELIEEIRRRDLRFSFSIQYRADTGTDERLLAALKGVGLSTVFIGVESGVDSVLERFDKGINKADITRALRIVHDLGLSANYGYILFNPDTIFAELKESIEFILSPSGPTILKLIGMMVLKGTPEEEMLEAQKWRSSHNHLKIRYQNSDPRVALFADWMRTYYPVYEAVARDFYELHFMIGDLEPAVKDESLARIRVIENGIRELHHQFLSRALDNLEQENPGRPKWINDLQPGFQRLHAETQRLLNPSVKASHQLINGETFRE